MRLDDTILDDIRCEADISDDPKLKKAKTLLERMDYRQHYKCVGEKGINRKVKEKHWDTINEHDVVKYAPAGSELSHEEISVRKFKINHGLGDKYPLNHVRFYDKAELLQTKKARSYKLG